MQFNFWEAFRKFKIFCCPCLTHEKIPTSSEALGTQLIQSKSISESKSIKLVSQLNNFTQLNSHQHLKENPSKPKGRLKKLTHSLSMFNDETQMKGSQEEFHSIESIYSKADEKPKSSSRKFKFRHKESHLKREEEDFTSIRILRSEIKGRNSEEGNIISLNSELADFSDWIGEYYKVDGPAIPYRISLSSCLLIQNKDIFSLLIHKLDDFKAFHMEESGGSNFFSNRNQTVFGDFVHSSPQSKHFKSDSKYFTLLRIHCNTAQISWFLKWLNSMETFAIAHDFHNLTEVEVTNHLQIKYPIIKAEQFGDNLKDKAIFHLTKQIEEVVAFEEEEKKYLIQIDYNLDGGEDTFQRITKIYIADKGYVEIYTESSEEILIQDDAYFRKKWQKLEQSMRKNKILEEKFWIQI